ncbi:hypothetical protein N9R79_09340 [Vibrio sp.]|nr:hypothetical protein [Vibrio sp.]
MTLTTKVTLISLATLLAACNASDSDSNDSSGSNHSNNTPITSSPVDGIDTDGDGIPDSEDNDDDNDGIPDSEDPDDDNDGILDEDEVILNPSTLACDSTGAMSSFNITDTYSDNASGDTNEFGRLTFKWTEATSAAAGDVTYTICNKGSNDECSSLGQTKGTELEVSTGGALQADGQTFYIHAQKNGEQSCSAEIALDDSTVLQLVGKVSARLSNPDGGGPEASTHYQDVTVSENGQTLFTYNYDPVGDYLSLQVFQRNNDSWMEKKGNLEDRGYFTEEALFPDADIVLNGDRYNCGASTDTMSDFCFTSWKYNHDKGTWNEMILDKIGLESEYPGRLQYPSSHAYTISKNGEYLFLSLTDLYAYEDQFGHEFQSDPRLSVYKQNNGNWKKVTDINTSLKRYITANTSGDTVVSAELGDHNKPVERIDIHNFKNNSFTTAATLTPMMVSQDAVFDYSSIQVNAEGNTITVSDSNSQSQVYVFKKQNDSWSFVQELTLPEATGKFIAVKSIANNGATILVIGDTYMRQGGIVKSDDLNTSDTTSNGRNVALIFSNIDGHYQINKMISSDFEQRGLLDATLGNDGKTLIMSELNPERIDYESEGSLRTY